ncbi:sensor histidine kinase [Bacillus sp. FJAT-27445]|uniref:sensor histidine kinase n=1 Tax=Bacillus sp. FJAT-27445 TaxID=1679166 RepID=UPI0007444086|nr:sensor histidine kinase [Bacillus sp. FJAT-27445]
MNNYNIFSSLRVKLGIIAIFLIAIPVIAISVTYSRTVKEIIKNKYTETAVQSVYETGEKTNMILENIQEFSTVIISDSEFLDMLNDNTEYKGEEFNRKLRGFITSRNDIEVINFYLNGRYYSVGAKKVNNIEALSPNIRMSSGEPLWLPTKSEEIEILSGNFSKNYFTLARKIVDLNTLKEYGYLLIDLEEVILEQAYSGLIDHNNVEIIICDNRGNIISHSDKKRIGSSIKDEPFANKVLSDQSGHNYVQYKTEKDNKVAIYSTIENNNWKIIKTISTDYLYEEINRMQTYLMVGGLIYTLVIISYILFFSFRYTEPMMKMMGVIKRVEQGDLTARTEVHSNDEVGQLGHSLNNMIAQMQVLIDQLIREEQEKREVELEALHAQINPHFLYNTLNTIKWMAKIQGNTSISTAITALVKLLRISINLGQDMITLKEEVEYVMNYIVIQKLRFGKAINIFYHIDESCTNLRVPKLILQPIVENSIIHGMEDERLELNIWVNAYKQENRLFIEITDNGPGIPEAVLKGIMTEPSNKNRFSKVGLNNVNQRIKLYFGSDFGLNIETEQGSGTKTIVTLPINPPE